MASNSACVVTVDDDHEEDLPPPYSEIFKYSAAQQQHQQNQDLMGLSNYEHSKRDDSLPIYTSIDGSGDPHVSSTSSTSITTPTITEIHSYDYLTGIARDDRRRLGGGNHHHGVDTGDGQVEPPHHYLCWSLFNCLFCNICCFGFISLYYSLRCMSAYNKQNLNQAIKYSQKAKRLNQSLVEAGVSLFLLFIIKFFFLGR